MPLLPSLQIDTQLPRLAKRLVKRRSHKAGLPPGTLVRVGEPRSATTRIDILDYDEEGFSERTDIDVTECVRRAAASTVTWINVEGLANVDTIATIGERFGLHPLLLEDLLSPQQRPKLEPYEDHLFIVLRMLGFDEVRAEVTEEQVAIVLGDRWVISFQERRGDVFGPLRARLRNGQGRIRRMRADYLMYSLLDAVVDNYFVVLERFAELLDELEEEVTGRPGPASVDRIHRLRREMLLVRRSVWPLRDVLSSLERDETRLVSASTRVFLRDVYDHTVQVIDTLETLRDIVAGILDTYLTAMSHRTNEVMKVLTMIATVFIPLTFIVGVYGMNFDWMPELGWRWGYPAVWVVMLAVAGVMVAYFRRKEWL